MTDINARLRKLMTKIRSGQRPKGTAATYSEGDLELLVETLTICREIIGGMPISSRAMELHVAIYHALATARAYRDGV